MKYHYVYRITNTKLNKHYYGARSSKIEPKDDLGKVYLSSSTDVVFIDDQKNNPGDFKYKIIKSFKTRAKAISFEIRLHTRFNVSTNESFYNRAKQTSVGFDTTGTNRSIDSRKKQSITNTGRIRPQEWCMNISASLKGFKRGVEFKEKCRQNNLGDKNPNYGKEHSEDRKKKISESLKNNPLVICPRCGKEGAKSPMQRWHFDNCKKMGNI